MVISKKREIKLPKKGMIIRAKGAKALVTAKKNDRNTYNPVEICRC